MDTVLIFLSTVGNFLLILVICLEVFVPDRRAPYFHFYYWNEHRKYAMILMFSLSSLMTLLVAIYHFVLNVVHVPLQTYFLLLGSFPTFALWRFRRYDRKHNKFKN